MGRLSISLLAIGVLLISAILLLRAKYYLPVDYEYFWMDADTTEDLALKDQSFLLSSRNPAPSEAQKKQPVCVLVHGFSASTFEFEVFKETILTRDPNVMFSTVLMGGHGRNYAAFKAARYEDWLAPILEEVTHLSVMGYENIVLFGVSAGATGILNLMFNGDLDDNNIQQVLLMDPYIVPKESSIYMVPYLKYIIPNTRSNASRALEFEHWYVNRPASALNELLRLVKTVRSQLAGNDRAAYPKITIYTAQDDPTADTSGADLIDASFPIEDVVTLKRYPSNRHVIIESQTKLDWSDVDQQHFDDVIEDIFSIIKPQ